MDMLLSIRCRLLINQIIYPQITPLALRSPRLREQIYTDLNNFKLILEYLFLRNLHNLWIINANFAVGWECKCSQNWEKIFILCTVKSQETKRGLDSLWMNCYKKRFDYCV
jgi:hypothetical protein